MTSGRTGCGAYPNARCFTYSLTLKPHFLASTAILLFSWSVTRNAIRFSFFINQLLVSSLFGGLGNAPKISPVSGLEGELAAHKFPACYTTGQPQPSTDRYVCFLPFVQRSISGLCQLEYPQGPDNPPPGCTRKVFLPPMRILLSDGVFGKKCRRVFQFCHHKPSNVTAGLLGMFVQRWRFPEKTPSFSHSMPSKASKNASVCSAFSCDGWGGSETD